ncbi:hypothetical protein DSO57_1014874 [Entomophthora muscae]|uniref:Uncharacterized protein n=1 Tax=Entomophthora muscae TaxID=34485 RepID=A0ACC2TSA1_9FUNG|nr:hypothetical protein DSO57_1014874 [Entomophthora muscae]
MHNLVAEEGRNRLFFILDAIGEWEGAPGKPDISIEAKVVVKNNINQLLKEVLPEVMDQVNIGIFSQLGDLSRPVTVDVRTFFSRIVVTTVATLLFGSELARNEVLQELMANYFGQIENMMVKGIMWHLFPLFGSSIAQYIVRTTTPSVKARQTIQDCILPTIIKRRALENPPPAKNLLESLIDEGHSPNAISHCLMILIFAAISTTTGTCQRLLCDLLAFPHFIPRLKQEQKEVLKEAQLDSNGQPILTRALANEMVHLNSAIRETLRHRAYRLEQWRLTPTELPLRNGMVIPKDSLVAIDLPSVHFNESVYGFQGEEKISPFDYAPFRFVNTGIAATRVNSSFVGFGAGRHACPGRFFAVQEVSAIMSTLLRTCDFTTEDGKPGGFYTPGEFHPDSNVVFTKSKDVILPS